MKLHQQDWEIVSAIRRDLGLERTIIYVENPRVETSLYNHIEGIVEVNPYIEDDLKVFYIIHEIRHAWQYDMAEVWGNAEYIRHFENYKTMEDCKDRTEYNLQFLEVDAVAYSIIMADFFFLPEIGFPLASDEELAAIEKRVEEIIEERRAGRIYPYLFNI